MILFVFLVAIAAGVKAQTPEVITWVFDDSKWNKTYSTAETIDGLTIYPGATYNTDKKGITDDKGNTYKHYFYLKKSTAYDSNGDITSNGLSFNVDGACIVKLLIRGEVGATTPITVDEITAGEKARLLKGIADVPNNGNSHYMYFMYSDNNPATVRIHCPQKAMVSVFGIKVLNHGVKMSASGMSTFCATARYIAPDGVSVYTARYDDATKTVKLTLVPEGIIPERQGVVLAGEPDGIYVMHPVAILSESNEDTESVASVQAAEGEDSFYGNQLIGTVDRSDPCPTDGSATWYVLVDNNGKGQFRNLMAGQCVPSGKAYLPVPGTSTAKEIELSFDSETSGITDMHHSNGKEAGNAFYTLGGQRVSRPGKGLYICNGKKVVVN